LSAFLDSKKELVAESGIKSRADVEKLRNVGVRAVLIGETLCRSESIESKFKELFG
jgi:indole-3-glycerol phosphate synthase